MGLFELRSRVIHAMSYDIPIRCVSRVDGQVTHTTFYGGSGFPERTRIGGNLRVRTTYAEADRGNSGRTATVETLIDFRGNRPTMTVWIDGLNPEQPCTGRATLRLTRGPLPPR